MAIFRDKKLKYQEAKNGLDHLGGKLQKKGSKDNQENILEVDENKVF